MANTIKLKRASGSDPSASDLSVGELAIRTSNCKLFSKNDGGSAIGIVAGSADTLTTARTIAGVSFDGSANISLNNNAITNGAGYLANIVEDTSPQLGGDLDVQSSKITTATSNGNVKIEPDGTGVVEVRGAGGNDGKLQLNCSAQSHGIILASPAHSAGQSYTLIFPDNQIAADKYLKIKSISGSGSTAIGQAEYASLDANDLGEGTIPDARFPSTLPALNGSALTDLNGSNIASGTVAAARVATLNQDTTGNAATATALETARTIAGVSFDGTANISLNNNAITNGAGYITATLTEEQVEDYVGGMLTGNTETGITVTYQDSDGTIDFVVASQTDENFTTTLKNKLDGIAASATNVTNTNQLTNGAGYITDLVNDSSPQLGGDLASNGHNINIGDSGSSSDDRLVIGAGSDLQLYHEPNNSYLDSNNGTFNIRALGSSANDGIVLTANNDVVINVDGGDTAAKFIDSGAVELYHNNSKKFDTTSSGVEIHGNLQMDDNNVAKFGTGGDLEIFHDGTDSFIRDVGTGDLKLRGSAIQLISPSNEKMLKAIENAAVELYYDNTKRFETLSDGVDVTGTLKVNGSAVAASPVQAWVTFNCVSTIFIVDDYNVSSITDNATGVFTVNFSSNLASDDYMVTSNGTSYDSDHTAVSMNVDARSSSGNTLQLKTTSACKFICNGGSTTEYDPAEAYAGFFL